MRRIGKGFSGRVTPLFPIMVVQNQSEMGEGLVMPTNPRHTPTILQPSSSQPQKTHKPRKPKRKDTHVPQPNYPTESVADDAVHKELDDRLVRAATTASSLEAKVLDLEKTKTTQQNEIDSFKRRVKKLKKRNSSRTHRLKRLYKVDLTARVESPNNEASLGEDASKQERRIDDFDADKDITLVSVQDDVEMFDVNDLGGEEVFVGEKNENVIEEVVDVAQDSSAATTATITTKEITLDQALKALKTSKPKGKEIMVEEHVKPKNKDQMRLDEEAAKRLQAEFDKEFDKIQVMLDKAFKRVNTFEDFRTESVKGKAKRVGEELVQEVSKKQKVDDDKETIKLKQLMEINLKDGEVVIDAIPLDVKSPRIVDWKIHKERKAIIK
nr:hypothetical protein [Tanacetum cinerariifolium]